MHPVILNPTRQRIDFIGPDCRDDENRFTLDQLDAKHGATGWQEVESLNA
jgi:hypothetical protein